VVETRRVIISVFDETGLVELGRGLVELGLEVVASGAAARTLTEAGLAITPVDEVTGYHEVLGGRIKTLHPAILGAILARTREDLIELEELNLVPFSVVVCNLNLNCAVDQIDISGTTLLRAGATNFEAVCVLCDPAEYEEVLTRLRDKTADLELRRRLALQALRHTAAYDEVVLSRFDLRETRGGGF